MLGKYVTFETKFCTGCTQCVRVCPTKAIRIRNRKALYHPQLCIGCSECIRACPEGAVCSTMRSWEPREIRDYAVAVVSPVLYPQFPSIMPCDVLMALKNLGFYQVADLSYYLEMFQFATEEFIAQNRTTNEAPWPLISPICPVINRLIMLKHPNLLSHIIPLKRPAAMAADEIRQQLSQRDDIDVSAIELHHITPCQSKAVSNGAWPLDELVNIDRSLGINDIYPALSKKIDEIREMDMEMISYDHFNTVPNARGPMWGMSGGEIAGLRVGGVIGVSGLKETMNYLEKIEMGLFHDMAYIELRVCPEGCIGGPLTAVDRYVAKSTLQKLIRTFGVNRRLPRKKVKRRYDKGHFFPETRPSEIPKQFQNPCPPMTLETMKKVEALITRINGTDCAACGAPDCRTFAEDVVGGDATPDACFRLREARQTEEAKE